MCRMSALDKASEIMGSQAALARALGVTPMAITQYKNRRVPAEQAVKIEDITDGQVKAAELRPDLFGGQMEAA